MPCTYIESPEEIRQQQDAAKKKVIAPWKGKLNKVTRLLCAVMHGIERADCLEELDNILANNSELRKWWKEHQKADAKKAKQSERNS